MDPLASSDETFKACPLCQTRWPTRSGFLADATLQLMGYQAHPHDPEKGLFVFHHFAPQCGTSLAIRVSAFADLYHGPKHAHLAWETPLCEQHCLQVNDLGHCAAPCSAAYVRNLMQQVLAIQSGRLVPTR